MKRHLKICLFAAIACSASSSSMAEEIDEETLKKKIAAIKVMTQQISTAATAKIENEKRLIEAKVATAAFLDSTLGQMDVFKSFSPYTGQGPKFCDAVSNAKDFVEIAARRDNFDLGNISGAGRSKVSPANYAEKRVANNINKYCTADLHNLGICRARFDGMNGASSNYSKLAEIEQFTKSQFEAVNEFIANLVPAPATEIVSKKEGNCGAGCQVAYQQSLQMDAFSSMVALGAKSSFSQQIGSKTFAPSK